MSTTNTNTPVVHIVTDGGCAPNPGLGGYAAILQTSANGETVEKVVSGTEPDATNQRMALLAVVAALTALTTACTVTLVTANGYVRKGATEWLPNWVANGWRTSKNKPVKHADLWQQLHALLEKHSVTLVEPSEEALSARLEALIVEARETADDAPQSESPATTQTTPAESVTRSGYVLLAGSQNATEPMLKLVRRAVAWAKDEGLQIVVGDNPRGVDAAVIRECNRVGIRAVVAGISRQSRVELGHCVYKQVTVDGRGRDAYLARDRYMIDRCERGYFIWDGASPGTKTGYEYMAAQGKTARLMDFANA